ncbi:hypothetical protein IAT38_007225 [Cryptococcus sp. DSM 104549]
MIPIEMEIDMEMAEPVGELSPETQDAIKFPSSSSPPSRHPPLYASLAEYTLQSSSTSPFNSHPSRSESYSHSSYEEQIGPSRRGSSLLPIDENPVSAARSHQAGGASGALGTSPGVSPARSRTSASSVGAGGSGMVRAGVATLPSASAQHQLPLHGQAWRPSPLLHEIQPPSRRLSSHQMLLLTPFGGPIPAGALPIAGGVEMGGTGMSRGSSSMDSGTGMAMGRGSSSMGVGMPAQMRMSAGAGERSWPRRESGRSVGSRSSRSSAVGMAPAPSSMGGQVGETGPAPRMFPRARSSLGAAAAVVAHSPLASAPMTTIQSESSEGNSSGEKGRNETFMSRQEVGMSRDGTAHDGQMLREGERQRQISMPAGAGAEMDSARPRLMPATVAMTRSNSLPVLTLRELDALKEKDGELGIQRGGDWAWVSREVTVDENGEELVEESDATDSAPPSATIITPVEPTLSRTFTAFQDPFAGYTFGHHAPLAAIPVATSSDYHYSPTYSEQRRMSDAPGSSGISPSSRQRQSVGARRPSAPVTGTHSMSNITPRPTQRSISGSYAPAPAFVQPQGPTSAHTSPKESPGGTSGAFTPLPSPAPVRPRITRYKSSPARCTGLGLNIVLRPSDDSSSSAAPSRRESVTGSGSDGASGEGSRRASGRRTSVVTVGQWAEVDFVDPLAAVAEIIPVATRLPLAAVSPTASVRPLPPTAPASREHSVPRGSTASSRSAAPSAVGSTHSAPPAVAASAAYLVAGFEAFTFKGRDRFESIDSALPLMPGGGGGRLSVPPLGAGDGYNPSHRGDRVVSAGASPRMSTAGMGVDVGPGAGSAEDEVADGGWPRRGSLGMGAFARLRRVAKRRESDDSSEGRARHWSERRGSWAEGWGKKE